MTKKVASCVNLENYYVENGKRGEKNKGKTSRCKWWGRLHHLNRSSDQAQKPKRKRPCLTVLCRMLSLDPAALPPPSRQPLNLSPCTRHITFPSAMLLGNFGILRAERKTELLNRSQTRDKLHSILDRGY